MVDREVLRCLTLLTGEIGRERESWCGWILFIYRRMVVSRSKYYVTNPSTFCFFKICQFTIPPFLRAFRSSLHVKAYTSLISCRIVNRERSESEGDRLAGDRPLRFHFNSLSCFSQRMKRLHLSCIRNFYTQIYPCFHTERNTVYNNHENDGLIK